MNKVKVDYTFEQLGQLIEQYNDLFLSKEVLALEGSLGAGKTSFVAALLKRWGVTDPIASPTFNYVNVYRLPNNKTVYHFDLYRLSTMEMFLKSGFGDYLYQENSICIIEWPEIIKPLLLKSVCFIEIQFLQMDVRRLIVNLS
ncbi:tRNA (adenosine(37)-N6)-threonylcarbamoyltransferase complex ATPase subunit type 1 TsaE [Candidatus Dependentiae bacterium]|nr:tRNA (adenosine(37)-N6)-threonylcarbamoyltransferase complex ATPase subunit type 1 TsaE [Candidatus Dependentiae bacterium]